jgi:hypothetical protein
MKFREANKLDRKSGGSASDAFKLCPFQNRRVPHISRKTSEMWDATNLKIGDLRPKRFSSVTVRIRCRAKY